MALPSTFNERLQQMEETRNQRISLLQVEKELQSKKSQLLAEKLSNLRRMEQRCFLLEKRNAEVGFQILAKKSEIDALDDRYQSAAREFRALKSEIDEVEGREKENDKFYEMKGSEMEEFKDEVRRCALESRMQVQKMRNFVSALKSTLKGLQSNDGYQNNSESVAAETRQAELLATKQNLDKTLSSNYQLRSLLQQQLQKILISQDRGRKSLPEH